MQTERYNLVTQPQNIFKVIKTGCIIWKQTANQTLIFALIYTLIDYLSVFFWPAASVLSLHNVYNWIIYFFLGSIKFFFTMSMVYSINQYVFGRKTSFKQAITTSYKKLYLLILSFIMMLTMLYLGFFNKFSSGNNGLMVFLQSFINIVGISMGVYIMFTPYIVITTEETSIKKAIKISIQLVNGNWWYIVGALFIISIILLIIIPIGFNKGLILTLQTILEPRLIKNSFIFNIMSYIVHLFIIPCICSCMLAVFYELQNRKKGDATLIIT